MIVSILRTVVVLTGQSKQHHGKVCYWSAPPVPLSRQPEPPSLQRVLLTVVQVLALHLKIKQGSIKARVICQLCPGLNLDSI